MRKNSSTTLKEIWYKEWRLLCHCFFGLNCDDSRDEDIQICVRTPIFSNCIQCHLTQLRHPFPHYDHKFTLLPHNFGYNPCQLIRIGNCLCAFTHPQPHLQLVHQQTRVQKLLSLHRPSQHRHPSYYPLQHRVPTAVRQKSPHSVVTQYLFLRDPVLHNQAPLLRTIFEPYWNHIISIFNLSYWVPNTPNEINAAFYQTQCNRLHLSIT